MSLCPIHIFTVERVDGMTRRVVIPGRYCATRRPTLRGGERILHGLTTWRSDMRYLNHFAGQRDYGA